MTAAGLSLTEADLERFFGVEASRTDRDIPWPYNGLSFAASRADSQVDLHLMPSYKHIELSIRVSGVLIYQLAATGVADLRVHTDPGHDTLEIVVSGEDRVFVRLSPSVLVTQQIGDGT
ncbi:MULTISPECIES: hypothetical protein [unclassified Pseudoxanthomonas]|jgi:hypothetical protein|uniref:hypothetical protein n=1 Tax=unclassified Pseudoxanthomonas TaxID=2645906 RepID=UPI00307D7E9B